MMMMMMMMMIARKFRKKNEIDEQCMTSVPLTRVNHKENKTGNLPRLPSAHVATFVFCGMKVFHVSYGM